MLDAVRSSVTELKGELDDVISKKLEEVTGKVTQLQSDVSGRLEVCPFVAVVAPAFDRTVQLQVFGECRLPHTLALLASLRVGGGGVFQQQRG